MISPKVLKAIIFSVIFVVVMVQMNWSRFSMSKYSDEAPMIAAIHFASGNILNHSVRKVESVSCRKLFENDKEEQERALEYVKNNTLKNPTEEEMLQVTKNCPLLKALGYSNKPNSQEEADFPIVFSILLHKDVFQAERLLRIIYQPQNYYCIHVDTKAEPTVIEAMRAISKCLPNVFLASKLESIVYASYSRLQAEINCMKSSLDIAPNWKYYINTASSVLPLRTNGEMVKILKVFNGANDIEGIIGGRILYGRFAHVWEVENGGKMRQTAKRKPPMPHGIKPVRGSAYGTFSRAFVDFIINDQKAKDLLNWTNDTYSPDELYWSTLHHIKDNPHLKTPGGYSGVADKKQWLSTYANWGDTCYSKRFRHGVCIFGIKDLPQLLERKELTANKFMPGFEYLAADCIEELLYNRTKYNLPMKDLDFYKKLKFIKK